MFNDNKKISNMMNKYFINTTKTLNSKSYKCSNK